MSYYDKALHDRIIKIPDLDHSTYVRYRDLGAIEIYFSILDYMKIYRICRKYRAERLSIIDKICEFLFIPRLIKIKHSFKYLILCIILYFFFPNMMMLAAFLFILMQIKHYLWKTKHDPLITKHEERKSIYTSLDEMPEELKKPQNADIYYSSFINLERGMDRKDYQLIMEEQVALNEEQFDKGGKDFVSFDYDDIVKYIQTMNLSGGSLSIRNKIINETYVNPVFYYHISQLKETCLAVNDEFLK